MTVDDRLASLGYVLVDEYDDFAKYERDNRKSIHTVIITRARGKFFVESYNADIYDVETSLNCSEPLTAEEIKLFLIKLHQIEKRYAKVRKLLRYINKRKATRNINHKRK